MYRSFSHVLAKDRPREVYLCLGNEMLIVERRGIISSRIDFLQNSLEENPHESSLNPNWLWSTHVPSRDSFAAYLRDFGCASVTATPFLLSKRDGMWVGGAEFRAKKPGAGDIIWTECFLAGLAYLSTAGRQAVRNRIGKYAKEYLAGIRTEMLASGKVVEFTTVIVDFDGTPSAPVVEHVVPGS